MTGHFRKKSIIFRDTTDNQEHDAKNRLLMPGPSSEKPVAEIAQLKKTDLRNRLICFIAIIFMAAVLSLHAVSASRNFIAGVFEGSCVVDQEAVATLLPCEVRARFS